MSQFFVGNQSGPPPPGSVISISGNDGLKVLPDGTGNISVIGSGSITSAKTGANTETFSLTGLTANTILIGQGTGTIGLVGPGTDNTVVLGHTGLPPTFGQVPNAALVNSSITVTSPGGTITIGGSPVALGGTLTIDVTGGLQPMEKFQVDTTTGGGTNPVLPTGAGLVTISGGQYAAGTFGTRVMTIVSDAANQYRVEAQISSAQAVSTSTANGLSHFNSARFTVDVNGFVGLNGSGVGETITGDSGGALNPSSGNWNILGRSGSKTSGSGSSLTVKSPPYAEQAASTTVTLNSGSFASTVETLTLPVSAGLADGDLFEFICTTANLLTIQAVGAQQIRVGTLISSAAGTMTSSNIGDALVLRFRAADGFFYATSVIGVWVPA